MTVKKLLIIYLLITLPAGFVGGLVVARRLAASAAAAAVEPDQTPAPLPTSRPAAAAAATAALPDLSSVAEAALRVSANISSTSIIRRQNPWAFWFDDMPQFQQSQSLGSGVVVSADGLILTNTHVLRSTNAAIRVTLSDRREFQAKIIGVDDLSDLAVVRIDARGLPTLPWGDSTRLRVAEWVLAIGNPFQLSGTVTLGIVSTVSRSQSGAITDFIQTDAAINPGNSGGALVNARGELIGINSMIYSETGGNQGIGFAIPSNLAQRIMKELVAYGSVPWGSIGFVQWIDPVVARRYGLGELDGPMVYRIDTSSAAYRGGLRPNDVLLSFDGRKTASSDQLESFVANSKTGSRVRVEVDRDGRRVTLEIPIESRQKQQPQRLRRIN
jgi:serine protease Do